VVDWRLQEAHNQTVFRQRNERIRETLSRGDPGWFVCECGDRACLEAISLHINEYETVRADPTHFVIAINHENPECETIIHQTDRYATVAILYTPARAFARKTDPRRDQC
jgi:3,4-dihydroxy-2-butanone 4-phosphate synthase